MQGAMLISREKKKIYFNFFELLKPTARINNFDSLMTLFVEATKIEMFAPPYVARCASEVIAYSFPKGEILKERFEGKSLQDTLLKVEKEQKENPETEEEKKQRIMNFSASLQVLQSAMQEDMQGYTSRLC